MKKIERIITNILIFILTCIICYVILDKVNSVDVVEIQPLVINSRVSQGTYKGVVLFEGQKGEQIEKIAYEGNIRIVFEGKQVRVFIGDDAVVSDLTEHF